MTALHDTVSLLLQAREQRLTPTRRVLVEILGNASGPLTIPEILDTRDGLAQSSVYRNLVVLEDVGAVHRVVTTDDFTRYELAEGLTEDQHHHHHLVCSNCGRVEDLPATPAVEQSIAAAVDEAAKRAGFQTQHHRLDLIGLCANCS
jgi:Fe2+ or Zn2+ uptake regulation protein